MRQFLSEAAQRTDMTVHVKLKLSALWATTVFCYVYGDLFGFFKQQTLRDIVAGNAGPNIVLGLAYTVIVLVTMPGAWLYYEFLSVIEASLTLLIVWYAWHWPRERVS